MKRIVGGVCLVLVVVLGIMLIRTLRIPASAQYASVASSSVAITVDTLAAGQRLAGAVKFPTISLASGAAIDTAAFIGLHEHLQASFPLVHDSLTRERVGGLSLLYTWRGTDTTLAPLVLMGHMDVVPVPEPNLPEWTHAPFSGDIADGFVWGRGTLDDKVTVLAILEAVEGLLTAGFRPERTVYLTFGHDEEVSGRYGARVIVDKLVRQGVQPALVLDEGGFMAAGLMPGLTQRAAIVGIAEKGYLSLQPYGAGPGRPLIDADGNGRDWALSRAIARLEADTVPVPPRWAHAPHGGIDGAVHAVLAQAADRESLAYLTVRQPRAGGEPVRRRVAAHDHLAHYALGWHQGQRPAAGSERGRQLPDHSG